MTVKSVGRILETGNKITTIQSISQKQSGNKKGRNVEKKESERTHQNDKV